MTWFQGFAAYRCDKCALMPSMVEVMSLCSYYF